jgi:predicted MFS family arabinose efflux permease
MSERVAIGGLALAALAVAIVGLLVGAAVVLADPDRAACFARENTGFVVVAGGIASAAGTGPVFSAVGALCIVVAVVAVRTPSPQVGERQPLRRLVDAIANRTIAAALWLVALPALLFGVQSVLVPLRLSDFGWGSVAIGAVFLATTALEVVLNPLLGRLTDRRGRLQPVRAALLASVAVSVALACAGRPLLLVPLVLAAGIAYGAFYTPGLALISDAADAQGVAKGLAFGLMNAGWALGAIVGPAFGGGLAALAGDALPYLLMAALCLATYVASRVRFAAATAT